MGRRGRKHITVVNQNGPLDPRALCAEIRKHGRNVGEFLLEMAQDERLTLTQLKVMKEKHPAFASAEWEKVALAFDFQPTQDKYQLKSFTVPHAYLPPSFHRKVMRDSVQWLDVYQERGSQRREAARLRLMDAWYVPVCALFKGRIVDKPETIMLETPETSGGEVEHEVYMLEGTILLVVELKLAIKNEMDNVAQVLLELASAYKLNSDKEFNPQPPVYAVLTDLKDFYFFSYDGFCFKMDSEITVSGATRGRFFNGMTDVAERLFSIILEGYISMLTAVVKRSALRNQIGDVSQRSSACMGKPTPVEGAPRPSLDIWSNALAEAREAQRILCHCDRSSVELWEKAAQGGLHLLDMSVSHLPKIGSVTDWDLARLEEEIGRVIADRCSKFVGAPHPQ